MFSLMLTSGVGSVSGMAAPRLVPVLGTLLYSKQLSFREKLVTRFVNLADSFKTGTPCTDAFLSHDSLLSISSHDPKVTHVNLSGHRTGYQCGAVFAEIIDD